MPQPLDATAVRRWCQTALDLLGRAREDIDASNVYPVADADTGTNLYLTMESAAQAVTAAAAGCPTLAEAARAMAHGALIGARGNSGTILAQLLRGLAAELARHPEPAPAGALAAALGAAARAAYEGVAHPVEGTMLTVARAAAGAARTVPAAAGAARAVSAAAAAAREALARTPAQLSVLAEAGVVDAGGAGLVAVLDALDAALSGRRPDPAAHRGLARPASLTAAAASPSAAGHGHARDGDPPGQHPPCDGHGHPYEVIYLLDAPDEAIPALRTRLDALGDSLVVAGGDGLWHVHLHTAEAGPAVEAALDAGRPHRIRIVSLAGAAGASPAAAPRAGRAVVAVLPGDGLAALCREAGATTLTARPGEPPGSGELAAALSHTGAGEVILLPNDDGLWHAASAAAEQARAQGIRVSVIPTRSPVQGIAALAVHAPERRFDEDVVAMTSAAGATRFGEVTTAEGEAWTSAGICQAGDVLGLIDGDVAVIGQEPGDVAADVLGRMLSAGGELVTLVLGERASGQLADRLREQVRRRHLGVETVVCEGRQSSHLLIGVE
ncbi:DAK2 domain-containing protein [Streptomyces sp. 7-21]|uniref:DAK2 domain-containing protein n=1 Tax=Streptomyces sp. 7-21 TaxID=2802283 RepID=UPI00191CC8A9|nr:DAK2 domain-containing protein [Streptomyces sp. 7-21]MBL1068401.1 DAK2 domain-containing protein [Streptomyces sp. 7-21]